VFGFGEIGVGGGGGGGSEGECQSRRSHLKSYPSLTGHACSPHPSSL